MFCQSEEAEGFARWADSLELDSRVLREIQRFPAEEDLGRELLLGFLREVRSRTVSSAAARVTALLSGPCHPTLDVRIGGLDFSQVWVRLGGPGSSEEPWEDFLGSLIRTEMVACFKTDRPPRGLLRDYVSPEFRMQSESRIREMWSDAEGSCMETAGAYGLVDPTRICNRITELDLDGLAAQHSQVVFNQGEEPFQDAYFKESLKTFVDTEEGVALHYINYTRAADLGRVERWVGARKIKDSQNNTVEEFQQWLLGRTPMSPPPFE